jgi:hypothetical protein
MLLEISLLSPLAQYIFNTLYVIKYLVISFLTLIQFLKNIGFSCGNTNYLHSKF